MDFIKTLNSVHQKTGRKSSIYKTKTLYQEDIFKISYKRQSNIILKWAEDLNRQFTKDDRQTKHKKMLIQMKATNESHNNPTKTAKINKTDNTKW